MILGYETAGGASEVEEHAPKPKLSQSMNVCRT
jgi:hypothetical protein